MAVLTWDDVGEHLYETGVDHGVLYIPDETGAYVDGVPWNGLTTVTEKPTGGEANPQYADNIKYLNLFSIEEFDAMVEAFTYPDEFAQFDGLSEPVPGLSVGQQGRKSFGLSYRTRLGNDLDGDDHGYKLHLVYGCKASPSEKAFTTINDSPSPIAFSWEVTTTPVAVTDLKPTSIITIDSTQVDEDALAALEQLLYGDIAVDPALPSPDEVIALFDGTVTTVTATQPAFDTEDNEITIPVVTGVTYKIGGVAVTGVITITESTLVTAHPNAGYILTAGTDDDWYFTYTP